MKTTELLEQEIYIAKQLEIDIITAQNTINVLTAMLKKSKAKITNYQDYLNDEN